MKLCLGTVQFGMDYGIQGAHQQPYDSIDEILEYAIKKGITQFDSAAVYGEAEDVIGHYIKHKGCGDGQIRIVSKLAAGTFNNVPEGEWSSVALKQARKSINSLGVDRLEGYLFHNADYIYIRDAIKALYKVKTEGLADKIGVSVYNPDEAMKALEYDEIEVIQIPYNLFDHRLDKEGFFRETKKRNIAVYARSTLLQGLIAMDISALPHHMAFAGKYLKSLDELCKRYDVPRLKAAIGYVGRHDGIDYIVFGVDSLAQLKGYISMVNGYLPEGLIDEIADRFNNVEEKLVNPTQWK